MAQVSFHTDRGQVTADSAGLHERQDVGTLGGWVTLRIGRETVSMHNDNIGAFADQLVIAARQLAQLISDEISEHRQKQAAASNAAADAAADERGQLAADRLL